MGPLYKVILVEDEIVTREGIRDNVNWTAHGFQFSGDASDGEMALSLVESIKPDLIITDIKMPFMDGLQLSKIVRERMPWIKIVILSGHDEFEYAHEAIHLGIKEYLLKPVTVEILQNVLDKMVKQLDQEWEEQQRRKLLEDQVEENLAILRERFLHKLIVGAVSSSEAMEKSQQLGLDLMGRYYLVVLIKAELADRSEQFDYDEYTLVQQIVTGLVVNNPDIFLLKKDWEEFVLLIKGNSPEFVVEEKELVLSQMILGINKTRYSLTIGAGLPKERITHIYQSFIEAIEGVQDASNGHAGVIRNEVDSTKLLQLDKAAIDNYLRCGIKEDIDSFFETFIQPLGDAALKSTLMKNYIFMDIVLATAKFINEMGGEIDQVVEGFDSIEKILMNIRNVEQLKEQVSRIMLSALSFRDTLSNKPYNGMIKQAKEFISHYYMNPELSLNDVAAEVNLSPSHFSLVFSQENDLSFKEFLTEIRIHRAKELLRTTSLGATEIAIQIGYSDPHYFSYVFKKNTGMSPTDFRMQTQDG
jgi:two-component system response regulator YesN